MNINKISVNSQFLNVYHVNPSYGKVTADFSVTVSCQNRITLLNSLTNAKADKRKN